MTTKREGDLMNLNEKDVADILKRENAYCYITINIESDDLVMDLWKQSSDFGEFKEELLKHDYYNFNERLTKESYCFNCGRNWPYFLY